VGNAIAESIHMSVDDCMPVFNGFFGMRNRVVFHVRLDDVSRKSADALEDV